jgi:N utilization substance protein A
VKLSHVIEELVEERGLDRSVLNEIICEGLHAAYSKKYPEVVFSVEYNKKTGDALVYAHKTVVPHVEHEDTQISTKKAKALGLDGTVGTEVLVVFEKPVGRIEILRAKQIIAQRIRLIEAKALYDEFKPREGTIVTGSVYKTELRGVMLKIGDALAFLPKSLMIPGDVCNPGYTMKALLKEVLPEHMNILLKLKK